MFLIYINEDTKNALTIDDVLCIYLVDMAETVIVNFYKLVSCFIQLLRNCINQNGFQLTTGIMPIEKKDTDWSLRSKADASGQITVGSMIQQIDKI